MGFVAIESFNSFRILYSICCEPIDKSSIYWFIILFWRFMGATRVQPKLNSFKWRRFDINSNPSFTLWLAVVGRSNKSRAGQSVCVTSYTETRYSSKACMAWIHVSICKNIDIEHAVGASTTGHQWIDSQAEYMRKCLLLLFHLIIVDECSVRCAHALAPQTKKISLFHSKSDFS